MKNNLFTKKIAKPILFWTSEEDKKLREIVIQNKGKNWKFISSLI